MCLFAVFLEHIFSYNGVQEKKKITTVEGSEERKKKELETFPSLAGMRSLTIKPKTEIKKRTVSS